MSGTDTIESPTKRRDQQGSVEPKDVVVPGSRPVAPASNPPIVEVGEPQSASGSNGARIGLRALSLIVVVVLPFLIIAAYYGGLASSQYVSEARFAVRSLATTKDADKDVAPGQGSILTATSVTQDAYVVKSFIQSSEIIRRLSERFDLKSYFNDPAIDWYARLPLDATQEEFETYWIDHVSAYVDGPSGIIILRVRAFQPETAELLAHAIGEESEKLINELSERARNDVVRRANDEVMKAESKYRAALNAMNTLQNETGILDPRAQATETGTLLTGLMAEKLSIDSRLFVLRQSLNDQSPAVKQLLDLQTSLQSQIDRLRGEMAAKNTQDDNLSKLFTRFAEMETERLLAAGLYEAAKRNLAHAQAEAIRQSTYLSTFVNAELPEESRYPRRIVWPLLSLLALIAVWSTLLLFAASVEDHRT